jgi:hypothetical protein
VSFPQGLCSSLCGFTAFRVVVYCAINEGNQFKRYKFAYGDRKRSDAISVSWFLGHRQTLGGSTGGPSELVWEEKRGRSPDSSFVHIPFATRQVVRNAAQWPVAALVKREARKRSGSFYLGPWHRVGAEARKPSRTGQGGLPRWAATARPAHDLVIRCLPPHTCAFRLRLVPELTSAAPGRGKASLWSNIRRDGSTLWRPGISGIGAEAMDFSKPEAGLAKPEVKLHVAMTDSKRLHFLYRQGPRNTCPRHTGQQNEQL